MRYKNEQNHFEKLDLHPGGWRETGDELILEVLEVYRDTRKESEAELTKINLPDTVFDQTPSSVIACFSMFPLFLHLFAMK